jgi:ParB-like chromosome segregation protein Spo0J
MSKNPTPDMKVYNVLIDAVKPYPGNARQGDIDGIVQSLRMNGQFRPIVVRKETQEILAGNHTWKAAKKAGWTHINVTFVEGITDEAATRIVLADNRYNDLATYNVPDLTALLESLQGDLSGTGFDNYVATNLEAAFREAEETSNSILGNGERQPRTLTCPACAHQWEA